jgi:MFS family permease
VRKDQRLAWILLLTTGFIAATYGAMFATLAEFRDDFGVSGAQIGAVVATGFFLGFVIQLTMAPLADRGHAKRLVVVGVLATIAGTFGMAASRNFESLIASRIVMGIGAGLSTPALRRIFILLDPEKMGENLGRLLAADVGGFVVGPIVGALTVSHFGVSAPFLILGGGLTAFFPLLLRVRVNESTETPSSERFALDLLRNKGVLSAVLLGVAVFVMIGTFDALWVLVMTDMGASKAFSKAGIAIFAFPLIVLGSLGGRLTQRYGPFRVATLGLTFGALCMGSYGLLPNPYVILGVGVLHGINDGLTITGNGIAVGMNVDENRQAAAQGLLGGLQTLAGGAAALGAGWYYEHTSRATVFLTASGVMLALIACSLRLSTRGGFFLARPTNPASAAPAH